MTPPAEYDYYASAGEPTGDVCGHMGGDWWRFDPQKRETFAAVAPRPGSFGDEESYREAMKEFRELSSRGIRLEEAQRRGLV